MTRPAAKELLVALFRQGETVKAISQAMNSEIEHLVSQLRRAVSEGNPVRSALIEGQILGSERILLVLTEYLKKPDTA